MLCAICEQSTHGFAIAALLGPDGSLGRVWRVPKSMVYRAIERIERLRLIRTVGEVDSPYGPARSLLEATTAGQGASAQWLNTPVGHARDIRSELMIKLALLDRAGTAPSHCCLPADAARPDRRRARRARPRHIRN